MPSRILPQSVNESVAAVCELLREKTGMSDLCILLVAINPPALDQIRSDGTATVEMCYSTNLPAISCPTVVRYLCKLMSDEAAMVDAEDLFDRIMRDGRH